MTNYHTPVMLKETLTFLNIKKGGWYIDCNLGGGGHTGGILKKGGRVLGIDLDNEAILEVGKKYNLSLKKIDQSLQGFSENLILYQSNFNKLKEIVKKLNIKSIQGILFDLGVSSHQLIKKERGFSFHSEARLDMRMDQKSQVTAADLINVLHESELITLFINYGEERFAKPIAKKIVEYRQKKKIETTDQLAKIITLVRPRTKGDRTHPATRVFQALRIAVNDELNSLKEVLPQTMDVIIPSGRLVILSFHSLEDRIAKNFLQEEASKNHLKILTRKPVIPEKKEVLNNPRSRSGKLRAAEKI